MRHGQLMNYSLPAILFNLFLLSMHSKQLFVLYSIFLYGFSRSLSVSNVCVCMYVFFWLFVWSVGCLIFLSSCCCTHILNLDVKWNSIFACAWKTHEILRFISSFRLCVMDIKYYISLCVRRMSIKFKIGYDN